MKQRYGNPEKKKLRRNAFTNRPRRGEVYFLLNNACCFVRVFGNPGALSAACACSLAVSLSATRRLQFASLRGGRVKNFYHYGACDCVGRRSPQLRGLEGESGGTVGR